jgi:RNA polymerase sigma-70 factor (ECF subfamily)
VRKQFERQSRTPIDFVEDFANQEYTSCEPPIEEVLDEQKKMIWFAEVVGMLPNQCQKAFMMKKVFGYSHKEIAGHLNISISTVEKHVANGLRRCGDYLQMKLDPMNSLAARDGDLRSYKHGAAHSRHLNTRGSVSTLTEP